MSSSPREDSALSGLAHAYYMAQRNALHNAHLQRHVTSAAAPFSDEEPSSDADSNDCNIDVTSSHKDNVSESGFVEGSSGLKSTTDEEGTDSNRSGNSGRDEAPDAADLSSPPANGAHLSKEAVKLKTIDSTRVAVAQVVNGNDIEHKDSLSANDVVVGGGAEKMTSAAMEVHQTLLAMQRQTFLQLQVLQSLQNTFVANDHRPETLHKQFASMPWLRYYAPAFHAHSLAQAGSEVRAGVGDNHVDAGDEMSDGSMGSEADPDDFDTHSPLPARHVEPKAGKSHSFYVQLLGFVMNRSSLLSDISTVNLIVHSR